MLIYLILKKSVSEEIYLKEILLLKEKNLFGNKRFSLKLKNGKVRDIVPPKDRSEIAKVKKIFDEIGIQII